MNEGVKEDLRVWFQFCQNSKEYLFGGMSSGLRLNLIQAELNSDATGSSGFGIFFQGWPEDWVQANWTWDLVLLEPS